MASADLSYLVTFVSWSILPNITTQLLLKLLYSQKVLSKPTNPHAAASHTIYARTIVIAAYFAYQIYHEVQSLGINYFQALGLNLDLTDEDAVKSSFRRMARKYHPDKVGPSLENEAIFIKFRRASDVLSDPVTRFAYERFGPSVSDWNKVVTLREYMSQGLTDWGMRHMFTSVFHFIFMWFNGNLRWNFWRDCCYMTVMSIELYLLTLPYRPSFLSILLPNFTPYEITTLLSKLYVSATIAFNLLLQCFQSMGHLSSKSGAQPKAMIEPQDDLTKLQEAQMVIAEMEKRIDRIQKLSLDVKEESERSLRNDTANASSREPSPSLEKERWTREVSCELLRQFLSDHPIIQAHLNEASTRDGKRTTLNGSLESGHSNTGGKENNVEVKEVLLESEKEEEATNAKERIPFVGQAES